MKADHHDEDEGGSRYEDVQIEQRLDICGREATAEQDGQEHGSCEPSKQSNNFKKQETN